MELLLNNLIKAIGWSILNSLWQGAIIYGLLLLVTIAVPRLQPRIKHNLAFAAIILIFTCFCITFFSVFKFPVGIGTTTGQTATLTTAYDQLIRSVPQQIGGKAEYMFPYLVGIYIAGLAFQLLMLGMGYKRLHDLKKAAHFQVPAEWKSSFEKLVRQLDLSRHIAFYLSDKINVPLVIGYFKPVVLFPIGLASQLDMDQVEAILIHELSHIRRNDYLLNLIKTGIETLLFFNPFIWLSGRFINIEREHACDDLVLKFTGNPMTYAHALLKLEIMKDKSAPAFAMAATGKNQHLYQRIKRITDMKTNYMNVRQQMFTITLAIATVFLLAWVKPSKAEKSSAKIVRKNHTEVTVFNTLQEPEPPQPPAAPETVPPVPALPKAITCTVQHVNQDTTKKKLKYTIITIDEQGKKKEYRSIKEMPENLRNEVITETFNHDDFNKGLNTRIDTIVSNSLAFLKSPEWKKSVAEISATAANVQQYVNSKEWKKQEKELIKQAENISKYFESKEWQKREEEIHKKAGEIERQAKKAEEAAIKMKEKADAEKSKQ